MGRHVDRLLTGLRHRLLVADLRVRISDHVHLGETGRVLDDEATAVGGQVVAALPEMDGRTRDRAVTMLARFHLCRWIALPEPADHAEFFATAYWFSRLPAADVEEQVPQQWRAVSRLDGPVEALVAGALELQRRLDGTDHPWAREQALALWRAALAAAGPDHPDRALLLTATGTALLDRADRPTAGPDDETDGITLLRDGLALLPAGDPERDRVLGNLASALGKRLARTGDPGDLDEVVTDLAEAVDAHRPGPPPGFLPRYQLATALLHRFHRTARDADVDRAVRVARRLVAEATTTARQRMAGTLLVAALQSRHEHGGDPDDLRTALTVARDLATAADQDDHERAQALANLGVVCWSGYRRDRDDDLLQEAVRVTREAARTLPPGHPALPGVLASLGEALRPAAVHTGATEHLREAVGSARAALAATPPGHVDYPRMLLMLGMALWASYLHRYDDTELDEAVRVLRRATGTLPAGHPDRPHFLSVLATALALRAAVAGRPDRSEVDEAIAVHREAIRATAADSPERPARLVTFAVSVNHLHHLLEELSVRDELPAVEEAVGALTEALDVLPPGRPERVGALMAVGRSHWLRFTRDRRPQDGTAAVAAWREVAGIAGAAVVARVAAAHRYAETEGELHGPAAALDGYATAVGLLPLLAWRGLSRTDQQRQLSTVSGLAAEAAAAAIAAGRPEHAVELLEQARGVLWTQLLETRTDVSAVRAVDAGLADEFEQAREALNEWVTGGGSRTDVGGPGILSDLVDRRGGVADRFDAVVERIRALPPTAPLPHPERFLRPTPWSRLRSVVGDRTVVIVSVSRWRADALVITGGAVRVVELPGLTEERLTAEVRAYLRLDDPLTGPGWPVDVPVADPAGPRRDIVRPAASLARDATLSWLWDAVTEPVLDALGYGPATGEPPRLWWCPTGLLSLLPLHAAGRRGEPGRSVLDRVVSSYLPTLRVLDAVGAADDVRPAGATGMLVVALPETPGQAPLPAVDRERRMLEALVGADPGGAVLSGPAATRAAVGRALTRYRRVHVSCHGTQDPADPSRGGLLLHDGLLSVTDLLAADRPPGDWIFLSACRTATGGLGAADEAITLAAALSYGGWRHVIGTLWSVDDATAARVAELVYRDHRPDGPLDPDTGARALHRALRQLRDERPDRTDLWAPFVHLGP